jgi:hypothetical protein
VVWRSEGIAMKISGKARCVFERYDIVDENDLKMAAVKLAEHHKQNVKPFKYLTGTI